MLKRLAIGITISTLFAAGCAWHPWMQPEIMQGPTPEILKRTSPEIQRMHNDLCNVPGLPKCRSV